MWPVLKILLSSSISGLLHLFVWRRPVGDAGLHRRTRTAIGLAMIVLWISVPVTTSAPVALLVIEGPHQLLARRTDLSRRAFLARGRYEHAGTQLYVTRGCGYRGPPVRLLAPLEITRIILRAA